MSDIYYPDFGLPNSSNEHDRKHVPPVSAPHKIHRYRSNHPLLQDDTIDSQSHNQTGQKYQYKATRWHLESIFAHLFPDCTRQSIGQSVSRPPPHDWNQHNHWQSPLMPLYAMYKPGYLTRIYIQSLFVHHNFLDMRDLPD